MVENAQSKKKRIFVKFSLPVLTFKTNNCNNTKKQLHDIPKIAIMIIFIRTFLNKYFN
jgi:hypothetical protein